MSLTVKETGGGSYAPLEAGTYQARCVGILDLGIQHNDYNGKDQEKVRLIFELPTERVQVNNEDKPCWQSKAYTASLHEKATLRKDLESWRGVPFTKEELAGFSLKNVIDAPCIVTIRHKEKKAGGVYAEIASISKPMKGMEVPPLENEPIIFDMDMDGADGVLKQLPNWMRDEIEKSVTWKARSAPITEEDELDENGEKLPF